MTSSRTERRSEGSRCASGSSSSSASGSESSARAIDARWRSPPESCARTTVEVIVTCKRGRRRRNALVACVAAAQREAQVLTHASCSRRARRLERRVRCAALAAVSRRRDSPSSRTSPLRSRSKPGDRAQQRRLAGAGRTDDRERRAGGYVDRDAVERAAAVRPHSETTSAAVESITRRLAIERGYSSRAAASPARARVDDVAQPHDRRIVRLPSRREPGAGRSAHRSGVRAPSRCIPS